MKTSELNNQKLEGEVERLKTNLEEVKTLERGGVKRKATTKKSSNYDKDDSDREVDLSNMDIDQDEPTYCLCEQVRCLQKIRQ